MKFQKALGIFFIFAMVFNIGVVPSNATFKRMSDLTTDSDPGGYSDHTFTLVTNDEIPPSGKIVFDMMLGAWVSLPRVDFTDVDVSVDGVDLPLGGTPGSGSGARLGVTIPEGADIEIVITLNNTDSIAASSTIVVEVGYNATYEYTGNRRIRNFAPEGDWFIDTRILDENGDVIDEMRNWVNFIDPVELRVTEVDTAPPEEEPDEELVSPTPGGGSFSQPPGPQLSATEVRVVGKSFPASTIRILREGQLLDTFASDIFGDFLFSSTEIPSGITTLTLVADDAYGNSSNPLSLTFFVEANQTTQVSNAYIPPTIGIVTDSSPIRLFGQTAPSVDVLLNFSSGAGSTVEVTSSTADGLWQYYVDTANLPQGETQSVKAQFRFTDDSGVMQLSEYSRVISFKIEGGQVIVEEDPCTRSDINRDGRVNLTDFSILLFNWGTADPTADINQDGAVNLTDFSIMLFCWTG